MNTCKRGAACMRIQSPNLSECVFPPCTYLEPKGRPRDGTHQIRSRGHQGRRFQPPTGPRKYTHSHRKVTGARVQSTTPTLLVQPTAQPAAPNCPSCSPDASCESSAADLARAREIGHGCSCCVTVAGNVSTTDGGAEMQGGAHGRRSHLQREPIACLH